MKSVLISIQPKWCELIASGKKTIEVRKTKPKLQPPFKCYIYCTKAKERLLDIVKDGDEVYGETYHGKTQFIKGEDGSVCDMYGKRQRVIGEFVCDDIGEFKVFENGSVQYWNYHNLGRSCLTYDEIADYIGIGKDGYGWHISDLVIYDKPKDLGEFSSGSSRLTWDDNGKWVWSGMERPPQSWCYVENDGWKGGAGRGE